MKGEGIMRKIMLATLVIALGAIVVPATPAVAHGTCDVSVTLRFVELPYTGTYPVPKATADMHCSENHESDLYVTLARWSDSQNDWIVVDEGHKFDESTRDMRVSAQKDGTCNRGSQWVGWGSSINWTPDPGSPFPQPPLHSPSDSTAIKVCP